MRPLEHLSHRYPFIMLATVKIITVGGIVLHFDESA